MAFFSLLKTQNAPYVKRNHVNLAKLPLHLDLLSKAQAGGCHTEIGVLGAKRSGAKTEMKKKKSEGKKEKCTFSLFLRSLQVVVRKCRSSLERWEIFCRTSFSFSSFFLRDDLTVKCHIHIKPPRSQQKS
jgi:hypothetical protein